MLAPGPQLTQVLGKLEVEVSRLQLTVRQYFIVQRFALQEKPDRFLKCQLEGLELINAHRQPSRHRVPAKGHEHVGVQCIDSCQHIPYMQACNRTGRSLEHIRAFRLGCECEYRSVYGILDT